jgi:hypothetical protein
MHIQSEKRKSSYCIILHCLSQMFWLDMTDFVPLQIADEECLLWRIMMDRRSIRTQLLLLCNPGSIHRSHLPVVG